ncbi:outer membrane beta-barrel protein [Bacteroidota bacterium]
MNMIRISIILISLSLANRVFPQELSDTDSNAEFKLGIYIDAFYGYDFNKPAGTLRLPYIYHYNRHNEVNLNHGVISMTVDHNKYRANLAFHLGTYVIDNYSAEPALLMPVYDANFGLSINKKNNLWLDIGIFGNSHIGIEGTQSFSNWTASRTILSENVPYYQAGINLNYSPQDWYFSFLLLNGWQAIQRVQGNSLPGIGTQVTYSGFNNLTVNWSTFTGTVYPDFIRRIRYFNHLNAVWQFSDRLGFTLGFDTGFEQENSGSNTYNRWSGIIAVARYTINDQWASALRYEYYGDPEEVMVGTTPGDGYKTSGISSNLDYLLYDRILCRIEARYFFSPLDIYERDNNYVKSNLFFMGTIAFKLDKVL